MHVLRADTTPSILPQTRVTQSCQCSSPHIICISGMIFSSLCIQFLCPTLYSTPLFHKNMLAITNYIFVQVPHESPSELPLFLWHTLQLFGFTITNKGLCHYPLTSYVGSPSICIKRHIIHFWMNWNWKTVQLVYQDLTALLLIIIICYIKYIIIILVILLMLFIPTYVVFMPSAKLL